MRILIVVTLFSFMFLVHAQVRTGGGADYHKEGVIYTEGAGVTRATKAGRKVIAFNLYLKERSLSCQKSPKTGAVIRKDFMQTYVYLNWLSILGKTENQCSEINAFFKCLYDKKAKKLLRKVLEEKTTNDQLKVDYELSDLEVKEILRFFEELESACPSSKVSCEM